MAPTSVKYPDKVDLENCAKEPIHIIGKSQSYGVLLVCDPITLNISQSGTNTLEHFGIPHSELLGKPLSHLIGDDHTGYLKELLARKEISIPQEVKIGVKRFLILAHFSELNLVLEFEPLEEIHDPYFFQRQLTRVLNKIQDSVSVNELCKSASTLTKDIFGYDRVMIYKFDKEWNGEVVAEEKEEGMESWLGLHYPATDIPAQSRAMFLKHQVRMIADVKYVPVRIKPELSPLTGTPLDLSRSGLRAVSPIHIEYLMNMEVGASLSSAIIVKGKLWGLIACHHRTPKFISYYKRESCRFLAQMLSTEIALKESNSFIKQRESSEKLRKLLVKQLRDKKELFDALSQGRIKFTDLISCGGGALYFNGNWKLAGNCPSLEQTEELMKKFLQFQETSLYSTRKLSNIFPEAQKYKQTASGVLSLRISENKYIIWFRPELVQTVTWGGDPDDKAFYNEEKKRLSPRKSFKKWSKELTGISEEWQDFDLSAARSLGEDVSHVLLAKQWNEIQALNKKLIEANKDLELFSYGLSHDLRAPVRGMEGYLQILREDHGHLLPEKGKKLLGRICDLTGKMNTLIDDILSYSGLSHMGELQFQEVPVKQLLEEIFELFNVKLNYPATEVQIQENLPVIKGDKRMLFQLWSNVINNAFKYSEKKENPKIKIGTEQRNGEEFFFVNDNGIGIESSYFDKIFDNFTRVAGKEYNGTGIGLAIVKKIVEKHKGSIWVESDKGKGTTFYFNTHS